MSILFIIPKFPEIEQLNLPDGRRYKLPDGSLVPSVSTVLSVNEGDWLAEWKEKVGEAEAIKISRAATTRGSKIHLACENFLLGKPTKWTMFDGETKRMYENFLPVLEKITTVVGLETKMYSAKLKVAGTCDLITEDEDGLLLSDWKTSSRPKNQEDIQNYFMQLSAYAFMFYEHTGRSIKRIRIHMTTQDDGLIVFTENPKDWLPKFIEVRAKFKELKGY
jgi:genome maintenance exonuclease 1